MPGSLTGQRQFAFAGTFLRVAGVLLALVALLAGFVRLSVAPLDTAADRWTAVGVAAVWLFVASAGAGALFGLAAIVDLLRSNIHATERLETARAMNEPVFLDPPAAAHAGSFGSDPPTPVSASAGGASGADAAAVLEELLLIARDLRDNSLLGDSQRTEKRQRFAEEETARATARMREFLKSGRFVQARRMLEDVQRRFPERTDFAALLAEVEAARQRSEEKDIQTYAKRAEEFINISAWHRAAETANELLERHPDHEAAKQLVDRVERDRDQFMTEQRRRMYAEIQRYVSRRRWRDALTAAKTFIERFPSSTDADTLRVQLATLEANAQVQERQDLEAQITDLAKHCRYIEAYNLARHLVETYPDSLQAEALRQQLPRLKELAHDPNATPARIRIET